MMIYPRVARSARIARSERPAPIANCRVVFATTSGLVLAFAAVYHSAVPDDVDPFWLRVVLAGLSLAALALSYRSKWARENCVAMTSVLLYVITGWFLGLTFVNGFDSEYALGLVFTIAAAGYALIVTHRGVASVFGYSLASVLSVALFLALARPPQTHPLLLLGIIAGAGIVIVLSARLRRDLLESLSSSEQRFRKLSEAAFEAIFVTTDERIVDCNTNALLLLGHRSSKRILGCVLSDFMPRDEAARSKELIEGGRPYRFESRIVRADGTIVPVEIRGRAAAQEGRVLRVIVVRDISEQKRSEAELIAARQQVETALETRNSILNNVSHEFRTPLAIMLGYAEMLKEEKFDDASELGELIYESGRKLNDTLNLILELAQIEGGGFALYKEMLDVAELADEVVRTHRPRAQAKGLSISVRAEPGLHRAMLDRVRLLKIVDYLVDNAIKFTSDGGIDVTIDSDDDSVRITVADTGIGIDENYLPHLFQPFSQQSTGLTRSHGGLGVGLSIAYHMAEVMGGSIEVKTSRGEGSRFVVSLPRGTGAGNPSRMHEESTGGSRSGEEALWI